MSDFQKLLASALEQIESCFGRVHRTIGDYERCATGEIYTTYGIISDSPEACCAMLENTFRQLTMGCAPIKPEGAPMMIDIRKPHFLYWRRLPEITGENDGRFGISCRAVVSEQWAELGQLAADVKRKLAPESAKAIAAALAQAKNADGLGLFLAPGDALQPWLAQQIPPQ